MRTYLPPAEQAKVAAANDIVFTTDAFTDLPAAEPESRPFPLVLFSHGFCGFRQQSSFLTTAMASWGFIVAAPEHSARDLTSCLAGTIGQGASTDVDDLRAAIPVMEAENLRDDGALATRVDTSRVAVVGHSAGGAAAIQMSADPQIATFVALAAGNGNPPAKPGLVVAGDADAIAPVASIEQWWNTVPSPRQLAVLGGVTHLGFMDACTIAADQGGILQVATDAGVAVPEVILNLYADGCDPQYTPAPTAWPAIRHMTIAQLRAALGVDPAPGRPRRLAGRRLRRPDDPLPVRLTRPTRRAEREVGADRAVHERVRLRIHKRTTRRIDIESVAKGREFGTVRRRGRLPAPPARPPGGRGRRPTATTSRPTTCAGGTAGRSRWPTAPAPTCRPWPRTPCGAS